METTNLLVYTNAVAGRDDAFNVWYDKPTCRRSSPRRWSFRDFAAQTITNGCIDGSIQLHESFDVASTVSITAQPLSPVRTS
jgi:hypothetical protein